MKLLLFCFCLFYAGINNGSSKIEKSIVKYFNSGNMQWFYKHWKKYREPVEHSLEQLLKETYGERGMNVYVRKLVNPLHLSDGFLVYDNVVKVLFKDLYLSRYPHLSAPEVSFALASNVLRVGAVVSKMFIGAGYLLFRNLTAVVYSSATFNPYSTSPFALPQVKNVGEATIVADGCYLTGNAIVTLHGKSVSLGHENFRLINCKFSVEISTPGAGAPPVIAPYFAIDQGTTLELLLSKALRDELVPKLQGAMFTLVNTSALIGSRMPTLRLEQQIMLKQTQAFTRNVATHLNKLSVQENGGIAAWEEESLSWTDKYNGDIQDTRVTLSNMTLSGLDSAYSAQSGGPYKAPFLTIDDTIRFAAIQIRGSLEIAIGKIQSQYLFYGEIQDAAFYTSISIDMLQRDSKKTKNKLVLRPSKKVNACVFIGWRHLELHTPNLPIIEAKSLVTGYLLNKLPTFMIQHVSQYISDAVWEADKKSEPETDKKLAGEKSFSAKENGELSEANTEKSIDGDEEGTKPDEDEELGEGNNPNEDHREIGLKQESPPQVNTINNRMKSLLNEPMLTNILHAATNAEENKKLAGVLDADGNEHEVDNTKDNDNNAENSNEDAQDADDDAQGDDDEIKGADDDANDKSIQEKETEEHVPGEIMHLHADDANSDAQGLGSNKKGAGSFMTGSVQNSGLLFGKPLITGLLANKQTLGKKLAGVQEADNTDTEAKELKDVAQGSDDEIIKSDDEHAQNTEADDENAGEITQSGNDNTQENENKEQVPSDNAEDIDDTVQSLGSNDKGASGSLQNGGTLFGKPLITGLIAPLSEDKSEISNDKAQLVGPNAENSDVHAQGVNDNEQTADENADNDAPNNPSGEQASDNAQNSGNEQQSGGIIQNRRRNRNRVRPMTRGRSRVIKRDHNIYDNEIHSE